MKLPNPLIVLPPRERTLEDELAEISADGVSGISIEYPVIGEISLPGLDVTYTDEGAAQVLCVRLARPAMYGRESLQIRAVDGAVAFEPICETSCGCTPFIYELLNRLPEAVRLLDDMARDDPRLEGVLRFKRPLRSYIQQNIL